MQTQVNATSMKEGRQFEACNKEDTPINCMICNNRFESPIDLKKHMISHEDTTKVAQRKPETIEECKLCKEIRTQDRPMHICRYCKTAVCNLFCSKQDPNFPEDKMKRVHRKGKGCRAESPPDEMKVKCPQCHKLFRGIDFKGHIKTKHSRNSYVIKCFECQYEAESLENLKIHAKQHYSTDKEVQHEKCNVGCKVFKNK